MKRIKLAIVSPSFNAYSETFIQAHKKYISANIFYYFGGRIPISLENCDRIAPYWVKAKSKAIARLKNIPSLESELNFSYSLNKNKIQVVLAEYGPTGMAVLPICKKLNIPLIVHFHGHDASVYETIKANQNYLPVFEYANAIIAVSKSMKQKLILLGCPEKKVFLNTYGPNDSFLSIQPKFQKKLLIGVGRFVDKKAPYYTIMAFRKTIEKHPDAQLILAGDGPLWNTCKNLVKHWGLESNVHLPGVITPDQYREHLSNCRAFVQHSITAENGDMEGTPLAVLEASAACVPVISTYHAGIPDVIIHQQTGLLSVEHDVKTMAKLMDQLLSDLALAKRMGAKGKEHVANHFSMNRHIETINQLILQAR